MEGDGRVDQAAQPVHRAVQPLQPILRLGGRLGGLKRSFASELLGRLYFFRRLAQVLHTFGAAGNVGGVPRPSRPLDVLFGLLQMRQ